MTSFFIQIHCKDGCIQQFKNDWTKWTCGDPSYYYNLFQYPEDVTKGFLTNDAGEIEKSKVALIEQIALYSNYTLTMQELDICLDVSLLF